MYGQRNNDRQNAYKSAANGVVIYAQNWKTLLKGAASTILHRYHVADDDPELNILRLIIRACGGCKKVN